MTVLRFTICLLLLPDLLEDATTDTTVPLGPLTKMTIPISSGMEPMEVPAPTVTIESLTEIQCE